MDKSYFLGDAEPIDGVNNEQYAQYLTIMNLMKNGSPFSALFKLGQQEFKSLLTNRL